MSGEQAYEFSRHLRRWPDWLGRWLSRWGLMRDAKHDHPVAHATAMVIPDGVHVQGLQFHGDVVVEGVLEGHVEGLQGNLPSRLFIKNTGRLFRCKLQCDYLQIHGACADLNADVQWLQFDSFQGGSFIELDGTVSTIRYRKVSLFTSESLCAKLIAMR